MMELKGSKYLTNEEMVVINAMRGVDKGKLRVVMDSCKFKNVN